MRSRRITIEALAVLGVAGVIAVVLTWPLAANFDTYIVAGGSAGDTTGYIWDIWSSARYGLDLWGGGVQEHVGLPFGRTVIGGASLLLATYTVPGAILGSLLPAIAAYNVLVLAGMALTGASMYLLTRWLGLGVIPAAWAGMAYEIFPYEALRVASHPPLAWLMFAPLLLMACIFWLQGPTWRRAVLIAAATLFAWLSNPYFGSMALVAAGVTLAVGAIRVWKSASAKVAAQRVGEALASLVVLVLIPLGAVIAATRGVAEQIVTRQEIELALYGARVSDYLAPAPGQFLWSGIFGADSNTWPISSPGGEQTAFLGWSVLILAAIGLFLAWRGRASLGGRVRVSLTLAVPTAAVMGLFSLASPYTIFGREVPMLSSIVFEYLPFLRVYARFSLFVMACMLIMGAVGLHLLIRNRSSLWRGVVASTAIILTAVELPVAVPLPTGPPLTIEGRLPEEVQTWRWLAGNDPSAVVLETPAMPNELLDRQFLYGQLLHGHRLANGGLNEPGAATDFGRAYGNPSAAGAADAYAAAGITYVVVNPWAWRQAGLTPPVRIPNGFSLVKRFPDGGAVWRVTARPAPAITFPATGWWEPEMINGVPWRYMKDDATMTAWAPRPARVRIRFQAEGFRPRATYTLVVTSPDEKTTRTQVTGSAQVQIEATLPKGRSTFSLVASGPPPTQVSVTDPRIVTLRISQWAMSRVQIR